MNIHVSEWRVAHVQVVLFPVSPTVGYDQENTWFKTITKGVDPETTKKWGLREDRVEFPGRLWALGAEFGKVTWQEVATISGDDIATEVPNLGYFPDVIRDMNERVSRLLELPDLPAFKRLGFACKLLRPAKNREDAYTILSHYLHQLDIQPATSTDLHYRINRRCNSAVLGDRLINRSSSWSASLFRFSMNDPDGNLALVKDSVSAVLELDINTVSEPATFPQVQQTLPISHNLLSPLLKELIYQGATLAEKGDVI